MAHSTHVGLVVPDVDIAVVEGRHDPGVLRRVDIHRLDAVRASGELLLDLQAKRLLWNGRICQSSINTT